MQTLADEYPELMSPIALAERVIAEGNLRWVSDKKKFVERRASKGGGYNVRILPDIESGPIGFAIMDAVEEVQKIYLEKINRLINVQYDTISLISENKTLLKDDPRNTIHS
jgi:hypothetical protein